MKTKLTLLAIAMMAFIVACGGDKNTPEAGDKLPDLTIEIPAELEGNAAVVAHIKEGEKILNSFSDDLEDILDEIFPYADKPEDELSAMEQIKLATAGTKLITVFASHSMEYATYIENSKVFEEKFNEEEAAAFAVVMQAFEKRLEDLNKKYEKFETKQNKE